MTNIEERKQLFKDYSNCKWLQVNKEGKIVCCSNILIERVSVDKDGRVYVNWRSGAYGQIKTTEVNTIDGAHSNYIQGIIQGIFTSEKEAIDITKAWFKNNVLEKIKWLEEELAELKKNI